MPQYLSLLEEIYDFIDMMKHDEDKWVHRNTDDGMSVWKVGRREFEKKYNASFEDMVFRHMLTEVVDGKFKLSPEGENELREFSKINT